jgi:hypothetical protein
LKYAESKNRKTGIAPPFFKMAAAAFLKTIETVQFSHLSTVFDEIWYTDFVEHAECKKTQNRKFAAIFQDGRRHHIENHRTALIRPFIARI